MDPDLQRNAVYVSSPKITPEDIERFYHIFDTEVESDSYDPVADYIRAVPDATWAHNLDPQAIYARHRELNNSAFLLQPVVIMDDRTKEDDTVLLLYPVHDYDEEGGGDDLDYKVQELRCAPRSLTPVLQNLEIGNMDFEEVLHVSIYAFTPVTDSCPVPGWSWPRWGVSRVSWA